ncbi:MAG: hypothetical protein C4558_02970 [Dehalococcoidia bacterium]|nr:MAG: hypothetical protein C4558_02970 [Dehalococcoidia bacterium]
MRHFNHLALRGAVAAVLGATIGLATLAGASAQTPAPTEQQLRNATYPTTYRASKSITLVDGKFDSLAEHVNMTYVDATYGTVNGTPVAVVHTATNTGGSGVFSEIYIVDASMKPFGPGFLGDRLKNVKVQIVDNKIHVDMITQGPGEPFCCGTALARQTWELQNGALVRTSQVFAQTQPTAPVRPTATGHGVEAAATGLNTAVTLALLSLTAVLVLAARSVSPTWKPLLESRGTLRDTGER